MRKLSILLLAVSLFMGVTTAQAITHNIVVFHPLADMWGTPINLPPESYVLAGDAGGAIQADAEQFIQSEALFYGYHYTTPWNYWGGYGVSNRTVIGQDDPLHQFTVIGGLDHTPTLDNQYAIAYDDWESGVGVLLERVNFNSIKGAWFNNITWTYEYMQKYYDQDDYYHLIVQGYDAAFNPIGAPTVVDLTNVSTWVYKDLNVGGARFVGITMESSDNWTPYYFAMDDLQAVPIPSSVLLLGAGIVRLYCYRRGRIRPCVRRRVQ